jgi:YjbE family integral membrane protein
MDPFSPEFFTALLSIIVIDLVLAGDNAIVIGMAARNLPKSQQKKVIWWGIAGAVVVRTLLTLSVYWLLQIPGLLLAGGLLLIWIAYKLLVEEKKHEVQEAKNLFGAIRTIVIADTVMGLDNVLAVAGAAHDSWLLVVLGLVVSIPIVVWGSTLFLKLVDRFPAIIYIGAGVLAWTAGKMIVDERLLHAFFEANPVIKYALIAVIIIGVIAAGRLKKHRKQAAGQP